MVHLRFEVTPDPSVLENVEFGGAWFSAWINVDEIEQALKIARSEIESAGWVEISLEEGAIVSRSDFEDSESLKHFQQAVLDGQTYTLDTYPAEQN